MLRTSCLFLSALIFAPTAALAHDRGDFRGDYRYDGARAVELPAPPAFAGARAQRHRRDVVWIEAHREWRNGRRVFVPAHWEHVRPTRYDGAGYSGAGYYAPRPSPARDLSRDLSIAGQVVGRDGRPIPGVTLVLAGNADARAVTGPDGRYVFTSLAPGSYAVRPTDARWSFAPDVVNLNGLSGSTVQNFDAGPCD